MSGPRGVCGQARRNLDRERRRASPGKPALAARLAGIAALAVPLGLASCDEPDAVLVGPREDLRGIDTFPSLPAAPIDQPIALPEQRSNADWPGPVGTNRPAHAALAPDPELVWSVGIGRGNRQRNRITASPVASETMVFAMDALGDISGVSLDGDLVWTLDMSEWLGESGKVSGGGLTYSDGALYATTGYGAALAIEAASGDVRWTQRLDGAAGGSPLVRGGFVYLVAGDSVVWALNRANGRVAWQLAGNETVSNVLGAPPPAWTGNLVVSAFGSGDIVATFPRGGLVRWTTSVAGQKQGRSVSRITDITGPPVVADGRVYAGNHGGRMVAIKAATGERIWTASEGAVDTPWPVGGSLFAITDDNYFLRLAADDGTAIWAAELPRDLRDRPRRRGPQHAHFGPILAGGAMVVAGTDGALRFFDPASGALRRSVDVPSGAASAPIVAGGTLYVVNRRGQLLAYR